MLPLLPWRSSLAWLPSPTLCRWSNCGPLSKIFTTLSICRPFSDCRQQERCRIHRCTHEKRKDIPVVREAHLALPLAGLQGAVLISPHHYRFIRRHASSVGQFVVTVALVSSVAKDIPGGRYVRCQSVMRRRGRFGTLDKGNVDRGVRRGRGAAVEHGHIMKGVPILFVEALHPWRIWRKEELLEGISQGRAWLDLTDLLRPGGHLMLAGHGPLRRLTLRDTAET